jgi:hypothetical protein
MYGRDRLSKGNVQVPVNGTTNLTHGGKPTHGFFKKEVVIPRPTALSDCHYHLPCCDQSEDHRPATAERQNYFNLRLHRERYHQFRIGIE